jgi:hypothetical protein
MASSPVDLSAVPVIDGHCHPLFVDPWSPSADSVTDLFSEARSATMRPHVENTGYYRRTLRDLSQRLGCAATMADVLERRRQLGADGARRAFSAGRIAGLLVDTGYPAAAMSLEDMRALLPCPIHEVFRIETCAQRLLGRGLAYSDFLEAFRAELNTAARHAVAFKSIVAYRSGLALTHWPAADAGRAYADAVERVRRGGTPRLTEKPLLDTLVELALDVCRDFGRPLQLHSGFGDPDIDLLKANPALLRPVLEDPRWSQVRLVILHMAYPYVREAAFMASVWPQLYVDLSLAIPFLGPGAVLPLIEMLSLAPSTKLLYGSDVSGLPELLSLSADWARGALGEALGWLYDRGGVAVSDAERIAHQILLDNACSLYQLPR